MTFRWIIHPGIVGYIQTDKRTYVPGDTVHFTVKFSVPVVVTGTPAVRLWGNVHADYVDGSGTDTLHFDHTITAEDGYITNFHADTVVLNGGTIATPGGTSATLHDHGSIVAPPPTFSIIPPEPKIQNQTLRGWNGSTFKAQIVATNAAQYRVVNGSLPPGLTLDESTGMVSGTATEAGSWPTTIQITNPSGQIASATVTFIISTPPPLASIEDQTINATVGVPLSAQIVAQNATRYDIIANIPPPWFVLNTSTGAVSGTPTYATDFYLTIGVNGGANALLHVIVSAAAPPPPPPPPPPPSKSDQTITFSSPVSAIIVGQPITLGATSSAGLPITYTVISGDATISGNVLTPRSTATLVVRAASAGNDTTNAASTDVNFGNPQKAAQQVTATVKTPDVAAEQPLTLNASSSSGLPITYTVVSGPATIFGNTLTFTGTGQVVVRAAQAGDGTYAAADTTMTFTAHPVARLVNVSSRVHVAGSGDMATVGFVVTGTAPKKILIRAVGDSLATFGVTDPLANPTLTLFDAKGGTLASNTGWAGDAQIAAAASAVSAFPLAAGKTDAALLVTLTPGLYSAQVTAPKAGSVLLEVYDVAATDAVPTKQLINISTRAHIDGSNQVFQGFVIAGDQPKRVLIRAVGATLKTFGVNDGVADPSVKIYSDNTVVASDEDWGSAGTAGNTSVTLGSTQDIAAAANAVGAFPLPDGSKDAALLVTLPPGLYSAVVNGAGASGSVLVEAYEVP
jgi:hypothetical protein